MWFNKSSTVTIGTLSSLWQSSDSAASGIVTGTWGESKRLDGYKETDKSVRGDKGYSVGEDKGFRHEWKRRWERRVSKEPEKGEGKIGKQWMPRKEKGDDAGNEMQKTEPRRMGRKVWSHVETRKNENPLKVMYSSERGSEGERARATKWISEKRNREKVQLSSLQFLSSYIRGKQTWVALHFPPMATAEKVHNLNILAMESKSS